MTPIPVDPRLLRPTSAARLDAGTRWYFREDARGHAAPRAPVSRPSLRAAFASLASRARRPLRRGNL